MGYVVITETFGIIVSHYHEKGREVYSKMKTNKNKAASLVGLRFYHPFTKGFGLTP